MPKQNIDVGLRKINDTLIEDDYSAKVVQAPPTSFRGILGLSQQ
jgi:hypothetical protein